MNTEIRKYYSQFDEFDFSILKKLKKIEKKPVQTIVNADDWLKIHLETLSEVEKLLKEWKSNENFY